MEFFATCPRRVEPILARELAALGATGVNTQVGGVAFSGPLEVGYRACLWSRTATRILLPLHEVAAPDPDALHANLLIYDWAQHLDADRTFAIEVAQTRAAIDHDHYAALRVKDAIVDFFRDRDGQRPSVDRDAPDVRFHVYLKKDRARLSLDLSGESLHRRKYRVESIAAPLKENLAAAILLMAGYGRRTTHLVDPTCGSGTFLIEAAMIAGDIAPGLLRPRFGFEGWLGHDSTVWEALLTEAHARKKDGAAALRALRIVGYDADKGAVRAALRNVEQAGLGGFVHVERRGVAQAEAEAESVTGGFVVANPPYGERLDRGETEDVLRALGAALRRCYGGWRAAVLAPPSGKRPLGAGDAEIIELRNGAIDCRLFLMDVPERTAPVVTTPTDDPELLSFQNRVRKNLKRLKKWIKKEGIEAYRIYGADLPQFSFSVDRYGDFVHVQEYAPPASIDPQRAMERREAVMATLPQLLGVPAENVILKTRERMRGDRQYEKLGSERDFFVVKEGSVSLLVNMRDYLDTGLFLDHRLTRQRVAELSAGKRLLNLYAYTGTASVHAAAAGAETVTVDMSNTYVDWARRNLELNEADLAKHELVRADVATFLRQDRRHYDVVFLDPPTFSTSKKMEGTFDVQRDHAPLIRSAMGRLAEDGVLVFSTNRRKFKLEPGLEGEFEVADVTGRTISPDFALSDRGKRAHMVFEVRKRSRS